MEFIKTDIEGVWIIQPKVFEDERGYFFESFNAQKFEDGTGVKTKFVQDNQSKSQVGVLRGLHYQLDPMAQAKLVSVVQGKVQDVAVDIRKGSPTYGKHVSVMLSKENKTQLYVPRGFAHGFLVLEPDTIFSYKCDNFYSKESEGGVHFNDPNIGIKWELDHSELLLSAKDSEAPLLENALNNFSY